MCTIVLGSGVLHGAAPEHQGEIKMKRSFVTVVIFLGIFRYWCRLISTGVEPEGNLWETMRHGKTQAFRPNSEDREHRNGGRSH
jgi:hypothetical protein